MSLTELLSMLRNQVLIKSELEDTAVQIKEIISPKPSLEVTVETEDGMKYFHIDFKQIYKPA